MSNKTLYDVFIIGGGINGVGIARDASGRGLNVALCDKGDLGHATSWASTKLIHGGLRYLEHYAFRLVRESLQEREILLQQAPHLVRPQEFIIPHQAHLRPWWLIRLGLFVYDHLSLLRRMPRSRLKRCAPGILIPQLKWGFSYYDCTVDDSRLVIHNAIAARDNGAMIMPRTECIEATVENGRWCLSLRDMVTQELTYAQAKVVVNAAGPWVNVVHARIFHQTKALPIKLIQGSHLVIRKFYEGAQAYLLQSADKRVIFVIPYQVHFLLVGTTDVPIDAQQTEKIETPAVTPTEINYLLLALKDYFGQHLHAEDVLWSYAGIRCLYNDGGETPSRVSRDYRLIMDKNMGAPMITVIGGKITTYRRLAEKVIELCQGILPNTTPENHWTATVNLPGGDFDGNKRLIFEQEQSERYPWLPKAVLRHYISCYGTRVHQLLDACNRIEDLGQLVGNLLYQREIEYLMREEWAKTKEDILWRRTKLGLSLSLQEQAQLAMIISQGPQS